ncbi:MULTISPECIES: tRNA (adenosine(37)-N6)-threonylcarbamoyltransferase complex dimerization subunit type 1 TsaB [Thioclava]|uniref:tRNA (Adenosine(37)-N6)-threonylcarbamoyltransferase complex dimerization subunit type 1 TsaB n=1 Tax=Thioclava nitratireducens TaxID=1915078 RepID=A0ABM6IKT7_9RHOB|nr:MULTISPECIES: tRNA (adenosine(37)-N6)-threonylcarbamoyltransferase complex dimerization subunit type 1 TsaB [Thioclava]AQS49512.1 tRNA (adenosine(37)-N6)-threonylcarbamoyltransferase complex dimerization subunit type 1 TsaB [Thioclava nitratireducens]OWX99703.1 tRNA (adenosine(37)-N6)-threonylcarbamoyltransferase complex dimerization subunit type 1 TsaB [Thioclava sp. IC9]OWY03469.1 tRNA (adenosine(37)-N6)-threonylcarbamoyltransferase complex dimerization subunit type 1 TsaB [Thioclava sp. F1
MPDLTLGFDTSAAHCAAALLSGEDCLASRHEEMGRGQAERLVPLLEELLAEAGVCWRDVTRIGVGIGPGNFTGVRIAVSAARGLSLSLRAPALGVSITEATQFGSKGPVLAAVAAPRERVYLEGFRMARPVSLDLHDLDALPEGLTEPGLTCIGSAAEAVAQRIGAAVAPAAFSPAEAIARIAAKREVVAGERPAPLYLRAADAAPPSDPPPRILD